MKCPHCGGTGEITSTAMALRDQIFGNRPTQTGGLANTKITPPYTVDRINRILSAVARIDSSNQQSVSWQSLNTLRDYLRYLHRNEKVSSEELAREFFQATVDDIAGRHKTLRAICTRVHRELKLEMLVEKSRFQGRTYWILLPFGETVAHIKRDPPVIDV